MVEENGLISGYVAPGFEPVAEEFERNFTSRGEVGAAFSAVCDGELVVDLWGGLAAPDKPWQEDTLQVVFSGTKGLLAACMLLLQERGLIELDRPVAWYWPEFAAQGKERVLVRHVVSHRSGLPGIASPLLIEDYADDREMQRLLAAQPLAGDPNAFGCYHPLTIGWLCGGLIRRIDGRSLGRFFAEEFALPLGLDIWIGLPEREDNRVGRLELGPGFGAWDQGLSDAQRNDRLRRSIWGNPPLFMPDLAWNTRRFHHAQIGGAGAVASARAMARFYACLANGGTLDGKRVLAPETIEAGLVQQSYFIDPFLLDPRAFGTVFALQTKHLRLGPDPAAFGHPGAGGSLHAAWPSSRTGFSYVMNQMRSGPEDDRSSLLLKALDAAIAC